MVFIAVQVLFAQQCWPGSPQGSQAPLVHTLLAAQVLFAQQRWPGCPQGSQVSRTHMPPSSQGVVVRQQRCPGLPHPGTQRPVEGEQLKRGSHVLFGGQHISFKDPQGRQAPLVHTLLGAQVLFGGQHGPPDTPH
jgi:hypothetical protein